MKLRIIRIVLTVSMALGGTAWGIAEENVSETPIPKPVSKSVAMELTAIYTNRLSSLIEEYRRSFPSIKNQREEHQLFSFAANDTDCFLSGYKVGDWLAVSFFTKERISPGNLKSYRFERIGLVLELDTKLPPAEAFRFYEIGKEFAGELAGREDMSRNLSVSLQTDTTQCFVGDAVNAVIKVKNTGRESIMLNDLIFNRKSVWFTVAFPEGLNRWASPEATLGLKMMRLKPGQEIQMQKSYVMTAPGQAEITGYYGGLYGGKMTDGYFVASLPASIIVAAKDVAEEKYPKRYQDITVDLALNESAYVIGKEMPASLIFQNATTQVKELNYFYFETGEIPTLSFLEVQGHDLLRIRKEGADNYDDIKIRPASKPNIAKKLLQPQEQYSFPIDLAKYMSAYGPGEYQAVIVYGDQTLETRPVELTLIGE